MTEWKERPAWRNPNPSLVDTFDDKGMKIWLISIRSTSTSYTHQYCTGNQRLWITGKFLPFHRVIIHATKTLLQSAKKQTFWYHRKACQRSIIYHNSLKETRYLSHGTTVSCHVRSIGASNELRDESRFPRPSHVFHSNQSTFLSTLQALVIREETRYPASRSASHMS